MYLGVITGRQIDSDFSEKLLKLDYSKINIVLVVVIKNAYGELLIHYKDKLNTMLRVKMKVWNIKNILFIDEEKAQEKGFVREK